MGKMVENPKINVISCRVSDETRGCIDHALAGRTMQQFLHQAIEEKLTRERTDRLDELARKAA